MFNTPFDLTILLESLSHMYLDLLEIFLLSTMGDMIGNYVHFNDVIEASYIFTYVAYHRWSNLGIEVKQILESCEWHEKGKCQLLDKQISR